MGELIDNAAMMVGSYASLARVTGVSESVISELRRGKGRQSVGMARRVLLTCRRLIASGSKENYVVSMSDGYYVPSDRMAKVMALTCRIGDSALRESIAVELMGGC